MWIKRHKFVLASTPGWLVVNNSRRSVSKSWLLTCTSNLSHALTIYCGMKSWLFNEHMRANLQEPYNQCYFMVFSHVFSQLTRSQLHVALGQLIDPRTFVLECWMLSLIYKEYQQEKTLRKAQLETKKQTMLVSIDEMTNGLLTRIDENVSKVIPFLHIYSIDFENRCFSLFVSDIALQFFPFLRFQQIFFFT